MKRPINSGLVAQPNLRRLLLLCTVVLVVLAFVRPGLAQNAPESKTAGTPKVNTIATTSSGLEATLATAALSSPQSLGSCPSIKCWITCDNGLGRTQYFNNTLACYSYSDGTGCRSTGIFVCSESRAAVAGC
jgi:hypothetical protein